jgi:hypothetical protein
VCLTSSHNHTLPPEHHSLHHSSPLRASPPARTHTHGHPRTAHTIASAPNQPTQHIGWQTRRHELPSLSSGLPISAQLSNRTRFPAILEGKARRVAWWGEGKVEHWCRGSLAAWASASPSCPPLAVSTQIRLCTTRYNCNRSIKSSCSHPLPLIPTHARTHPLLSAPACQACLLCVH